MRFLVSVLLVLITSFSNFVFASQVPVRRLSSTEAPVFYIWFDADSYAQLKSHPLSASNIFFDSRTIPIYGWHTPLGALAEKLGSRTSLGYGTTLVKVTLDKPKAIRRIDAQPAHVTKGELLFHIFAIPRMMQFQEWIFSADDVREWSAYTPEIESDLRADLANYRAKDVPYFDRHFYGERFDLDGTIAAAEIILANFHKHQSERKIRPSSLNALCESVFVSKKP